MKSPARSPQAPGHTTRGRDFDRHSATGTRGLPKKNGAGGKGVWGAMLDQEGVTHLDENDPNYDPDEQEHDHQTAADAVDADSLPLEHLQQPPAIHLGTPTQDDAANLAADPNNHPPSTTTTTTAAAASNATITTE